VPWQECPEVIMGHSTRLNNAIINKIGKELKDLAKWMRKWDEQVANDEREILWQRGQQGQCRQSNHKDVCHPWNPLEPNGRPRFKNEERRVAARFYGAILDWAASKGKGLEFWKHSDSLRPTIILRAIRAIWKKEKCQMDVLYEYEKNLETTYYIPVTLFVCMQEQFPILMWAEMFRLSPDFAFFHGPKKVLLAIELCLQGNRSPWKNAQSAIEDKHGTEKLALTNEPHQDEGSKRGSGEDKRPRTTSWSGRSSHQEWSADKGTWEGWTSYPTTVGSGSGWWEKPGTGASSYDAMSSTSEASSRGTWYAAGYGMPKQSPTTSWEQQGADTKPPWRKT